MFLIRFINFVVSETKPSLKRLAMDASIYSSSTNEYTLISFEIEYTLSKIFVQEIELGKNLFRMLHQLSQCYDFNCFDLFKVLDNFNQNIISEEK